MEKHLLDIVWSIFIGKVVDYGTILSDDFNQYVGKGSPKEGLTNLTSSFCLSIWWTFTMKLKLVLEMKSISLHADISNDILIPKTNLFLV